MKMLWKNAIAAPPPTSQTPDVGPTMSQQPEKSQTGTPDISLYTNMDEATKKMFVNLIDYSNKLKNLLRDPKMPSDIKAIVDKFVNQVSQKIGTVLNSQMSSEKVQEWAEKGKYIVPQEKVMTNKPSPYTPLQTKFKS